MKKYIALITMQLIALATLAQIGSTIQKVKVYQNGAQISRTASVKLKSGINKIELNGLSPYVNISSLQLKIPNAIILSSTFKKNYLDKNSNNDRAESLRDSIDLLDIQITTEKNRKKSLQEELNLVLINNKIKGQESLDVADLTEFTAYYRKKLPEIRSKILITDLKIKRIQKQQRKMKKQLRELNPGAKTVTGAIVVEASCPNATNTKVEFSYVVQRCGWIPFYDVRAKDLKSKVRVDYNAHVFQNTGIDWKNVDLTLATGNPIRNGVQPKLYPWRVYASKSSRKSFSYLNEEQILAGFNDVDGDGVMDEFDKDLKTPKGATVNARAINRKVRVDQSITFTEFVISTKYNIPANNKKHRVEITKHELPTSYEYLAIPKKDNSVYLLANIREWQSKNFLSGATNIFFKETFVGKSYLNAKSTRDTLEVSLGQDRSIVVKRDIEKELCKSQVIGSKKSLTRAFKFEIKNNKSIPINIKVVDQIPVTSTGNVKIEVLESSGAVPHPNTGRVEWKFELPALQAKTLNLSFNIKYPKKYTLHL